MDLEADWNTIRHVFESGVRSSKHSAIGTVDADGNPHITPIGFAFLRDDRTAYYFEQYPKRLPLNLETHKNVCMAVNSSPSFWLRSLLRARFLSHPGIRLYGEAGTLRPATAPELAQLNARIGLAKHLPGSKLIWSGLKAVRDIKLTAVEPVRYPRMMEHLR